MERVRGPLPENAFVVAARDSLPQARARATTATTRGTGRGKRKTPATRPTVGKQQGASNSRGRRNTSSNKVQAASTSIIPDLNDVFIPQDHAHEVPLSQNAPPPTEEM